jgi:hypothetical protein
MLERTFDTFVYGGYDFAYNCRKVIYVMVVVS